MIARILIILTICVSQILHADEINSEMRLKDFNDVISTLETHYAFWWNRKVTLEQLIEKYKPLISKNSDAKNHYILLNKLIYELHDGHGFVIGPFDQGKLVNAGFKVEKVGDDIYVTEVKDNSGNPMPELGWKLISVNGIFVNQLLEQFSDYASGTDWSWNAVKTELLASVELKKPYKFLFSTKKGNKEIIVTIEKRSGINYLRSTMFQNSELPIVESKLLSEKLGYLRINGLSSQDDVYAEYLKAITELKNKNIQNLILDLRYSMGGGGVRVTDIFSTFTPTKTEIGASCEHADKNCAVKSQTNLVLGYKYVTDPTKYLFGGKVVALIGPLCRSACEFLAGALKYSKRAVLIGDRTAGAMGTFQCGRLPSNEKNREARMCLSTGVLSVFGNVNDGKGIEPDKKIDRRVTDLSNGEDTLIKEATELFQH